MKKILATILVASMLLSMSLVAFAAVGDGTTKFYTIENVPSAEFTEAMASDYTDWECVIPEVVKPGDDILFPIFFEENTGIMALKYVIEYDPDYIIPHPEYADVRSDFEGWQKNILGISGEVHSLFAVADSSVADTFGNLPAVKDGKKMKIVTEGTVQVINFQVNPTAPANATTAIKFTITEYKAAPAQNADLVTYPANVTASTMTVKIGNGGATVEKEEAKVENLTAAVEFTGEVSAESFAQIPAEQITSGDGVVYNYNTHGDYRIFFGKFVADTYKQPTAQGFIIKGGKADVKAAAKTTFKAGEPFGILVFGMGSQTELTAEPFIEY